MQTNPQVKLNCTELLDQIRGITNGTEPMPKYISDVYAGDDDPKFFNKIMHRTTHLVLPLLNALSDMPRLLNKFGKEQPNAEFSPEQLREWIRKNYYILGSEELTEQEKGALDFLLKFFDHMTVSENITNADAVEALKKEIRNAIKSLDEFKNEVYKDYQEAKKISDIIDFLDTLEPAEELQPQAPEVLNKDENKEKISDIIDAMKTEQPAETLAAQYEVNNPEILEETCTKIKAIPNVQQKLGENDRGLLKLLNQLLECLGIRKTTFKSLVKEENKQTAPDQSIGM